MANANRKIDVKSMINSILNTQISTYELTVDAHNRKQREHRSEFRSIYNRFYTSECTSDNLTFLDYIYKNVLQSGFRSAVLEKYLSYILLSIRKYLFEKGITKSKVIFSSKLLTLPYSSDCKNNIQNWQENHSALYTEMLTFLKASIFNYSESFGMLSRILDEGRQNDRRNISLFLKYPWVWTENPEVLRLISVGIHSCQFDMVRNTDPMFGPQYYYTLSSNTRRSGTHRYKIGFMLPYTNKNISHTGLGQAVYIKKRSLTPIPAIDLPVIFSEFYVEALVDPLLLKVNTFIEYMKSKSYMIVIRYLRFLNRTLNNHNLSIYILFPTLYADATGISRKYTGGDNLLENVFYKIEELTPPVVNSIADKYSREAEVANTVLGESCNVDIVPLFASGITILLAWTPRRFTEEEVQRLNPLSRIITNEMQPVGEEKTEASASTSSVSPYTLVNSADILTGIHKHNILPPIPSMLKADKLFASLEEVIIRSQHEFIGTL